MSWAPSCSGAGAPRRALSLFRRAPAVFCVGDRRPVGQAEGWSTGPDGGSELLVRSGWWDPIVRRVPAVHVIRASSSGVVLRIDRARFVRQQRYLPDPELVDAVYHTLRTDALRYMLTRFVGIHARNGVIRASGNLVSEAHRQAALRPIAATPGVLRVEDELATDERITSAIALAMLPHRTLQPSRVHVPIVLRLGLAGGRARLTARRGPGRGSRRRCPWSGGGPERPPDSAAAATVPTSARGTFTARARADRGDLRAALDPGRRRAHRDARVTLN